MYTDIDIFGREKPNGAPIEYQDEEAVKNALVLWFSSKRGEFVREPSIGGVLDALLFKSITPQNIDRTIFSIRTIITNNFLPKIKLIAVNVIPNYEQRYIEVVIEYEDPFTGKRQKANIYTKDPSTRTTFTYIDIDYEGENLENFALLKKPGMQGKNLIYASEYGCFVWGQYKFTNLTPESDNLVRMLSIING